MSEENPEFSVKLTNFEGPFDLLLQLISRHKMDVTEVALSVVTDEFLTYIADAKDGNWSMDKTSSFLVVAATLLDLKAARLLPQGEVEDEEDLEALQARDLLFARLLQYRAFKIVAEDFGRRIAGESHSHARPGGLEERFAKLMPEVNLSGMAEKLAELAAQALTPKEPEHVSLAHLHVPKVSVTEQAEIISARLKEKKTLSFRALVADAGEKLVVVARFLALLYLYRAMSVSFEQLTPLGELNITWIGGSEGQVETDFDDERVEEAKEIDV
ncbi:MAG: segregation/condensation protein A [Propionibacteriaceae bacterium]|nr:segregation/condensation protein A [Propionibacteriaceae bacterium]